MKIMARREQCQYFRKKAVIMLRLLREAAYELLADSRQQTADGW
jgi:hypothetical protein